MKYFINGWRYGKSYFMSIGRFTEDEMQRLEDGETITKNDNEFWIVKEEV